MPEHILCGLISFLREKLLFI